MKKELSWLRTMGVVAGIVGLSSPSFAVPVVEQTSGANAAAIQASVDAFRARISAVRSIRT